MGREKELLELFPLQMRRTYERAATQMAQIQEIRLRVGRPVMIHSQGKEKYLTEDGRIIYEAANAFCPGREYLDRLLNHICGYSAYAFEEEIRRGFLTVPGGHRIGLSGEVVLSGHEIISMKNLNALNIRIAHQIKGAADGVMRYISPGGGIRNTLIVSPPGCGKTTLLRDVIRQLSVKFTIGVVDERSEIGGSFQGEMQNDLGPRTDVLDGCPKEIGMTMLLRSMNPQVLAVDEIGTCEDADAIGQAIRSGCYVIATVHGENVRKLAEKRGIGELVQQKVFERYVVLCDRKKPGSILEILDGNYQRMDADETDRSNIVGLRDNRNGSDVTGAPEKEDYRNRTGNLAFTVYGE